MSSPWIGITIAVADDDRGKNAADSGFYSGWKVGNSWSWKYFHPGSSSRPCWVCWSKQKGNICWHWKRGKTWESGKWQFLPLFFRCQLRCPPQWRIQQTMWSLWVPREGNVCLSLRLPALCTRCITVLQNCPLLTFFWQAIFFSKYTKSSCQLENSLKNLLDKFKYGGNYCLPLFH